MRIVGLALAAFVAAAFLVDFELSAPASADAGEEASPIYVSGDAQSLTFWHAGEPPQAVTFTLGYADPKIGTGPWTPGAEPTEPGPPMLFRTGPAAGNWAVPRTRDLVTLGSARWDEGRQVLVSSGPGDALAFWELEAGEPVRARRLLCQVSPPFLEHEERQVLGGSQEEIHVSLPARNVVESVVFEKAPAGRIPGPPALR